MAKVNVSDVNPLKHIPYIVHTAPSFRPLPSPAYVNFPLSLSLSLSFEREREISFPLILRREMPETNALYNIVKRVRFYSGIIFANICQF